eukprot:SAG31_NODE_9802_length_1225_cov_1.165187_1_plen_156_part_10
MRSLPRSVDAAVSLHQWRQTRVHLRSTFRRSRVVSPCAPPSRSLVSAAVRLYRFPVSSAGHRKTIYPALDTGNQYNRAPSRSLVSAAVHSPLQSKRAVCMSGCGLLLTYHLGIASKLRDVIASGTNDKASVDRLRFVGCSGGAIAAAVAVCMPERI